jgi:hypothetical protein
MIFKKLFLLWQMSKELKEMKQRSKSERVINFISQNTALKQMKERQSAFSGLSQTVGNYVQNNTNLETQFSVGYKPKYFYNYSRKRQLRIRNSWMMFKNLREN